MGWILLRIRRYVSYVWWGLQVCRFFAFETGAAGYNVPYHVMQRMVQAVTNRNMTVFEAMDNFMGGAGARHQDCPLSTSVQSNEIVFCISKTLAGPSPSRILKLVSLHLGRFEITYIENALLGCVDFCLRTYVD